MKGKSESYYLKFNKNANANVIELSMENEKFLYSYKRPTVRK